MISIYKLGNNALLWNSPGIHLDYLADFLSCISTMCSFYISDSIFML